MVLFTESAQIAPGIGEQGNGFVDASSSRQDFGTLLARHGQKLRHIQFLRLSLELDGYGHQTFRHLANRQPRLQLLDGNRKLVCRRGLHRQRAIFPVSAAICCCRSAIALRASSIAAPSSRPSS